MNIHTSVGERNRVPFSFTPLIASVYEQTHTNTTHAHLTHTPRTQTDHTTPRRFKDRVLKEITETQGSAGNERAAILLWLHAREAAALVIMEKTLVGILS